MFKISSPSRESSPGNIRYCHSPARIMEGRNFHTGRSTPSTIQPFGGFPNSSVNVQQDFCMSRPNLTGFCDTRSGSTHRPHNVLRTMPAGGQQYFPPTTYAQTAPVLASVPTAVADDWGFRPDPNIEGHWIAVLQSHGPPPTQHQDAQTEYPMQYSEHVNQFQYQVRVLCGHHPKLLTVCTRCIRTPPTCLPTHRRSSLI